MTYREVCAEGERLLAAAGIEEARLEARLLLEYVCKISHSDLLAHGDRPVAEDERSRYERLTAERSRRIPLQYLTGTQDFMGLTFLVNRQVLIPRQDTEILVEEVLKNLHDGMRILDMCTGSGCILISLLHYSNNCQGVGADISELALQIARENGARLLCKDNGAQDGGDLEPRLQTPDCRFVKSDLFENVEGIFDIIVSNPPYIPSAVIETLMPEVKDHEPRQALDGMADGLFWYRRIVADGTAHLAGGGMLFFEIGCDQAEAVCRLMEEAGFLEINVIKDYAGLDRVVYGAKGFAL